jgi:hypothetical protein
VYDSSSAVSPDGSIRHSECSVRCIICLRATVVPIYRPGHEGAYCGEACIGRASGSQPRCTVCKDLIGLFPPAADGLVGYWVDGVYGLMFHRSLWVRNRAKRHAKTRKLCPPLRHLRPVHNKPCLLPPRPWYFFSVKLGGLFDDEPALCVVSGVYCSRSCADANDPVQGLCCVCGHAIGDAAHVIAPHTNTKRHTGCPLPCGFCSTPTLTPIYYKRFPGAFCSDKCGAEADPSVRFGCVSFVGFCEHL